MSRRRRIVPIAAATVIALVAGSILFIRLGADTCRRIAQGAAAPTPGEVAGVDVTDPTSDDDRFLFAEDFELFEPGARWRQGTVCGSLRVQYHGYGSVGTRAAGDDVVHHQRPRSARSKDDTHASMVTSTVRFGEIDFRVRTRTVRHVRDGKPNPWEVSWIVWAYTDDRHFYYFVPKPNGWELGKRDPDYPGGQRDLKTDSRPTFPIGRWYDVRVRHVGTRMRVWVDGKEIVRFADTERPYRRGAIGLYNEDAQVQFDDIVVDEP